MSRAEVIRGIREQWETVLQGMTQPARSRVNGKTSYVCPICGHGEHGDGLTFNPRSKDKNSLTCFGKCGFKGDIIDLYMQVNGCDFDTAVTLLKDDLFILEFEDEPKDKPLPNTTKAPAEDAEHAETNENAPATDFTEYYKKCAQTLAESEAAQSYLTARGFTPELWQRHMIGFDQNADPAQTGYTTPRIIIPINRGHFIGRRIDGNPDYKAMNNKNCTTGFFNWKTLYAGNDSVFIVEGWADALSIEAVEGTAVALNSTTQAERFLKQLQEHPTTAAMIVCLDNDGAGAKAAEALRTGFKQLGLKYIDANITGTHKDANEAYTADKEVFRAAVADAITAAQKEASRDDLDIFLEKIQTEAYKPHKTGLSFFDDLLGGGVVQQSLLLLMAAPGRGKTTLCQQIAEELAANKTPVVYLNFEMSREQMLAKAISYRLAKKPTGLHKTAMQVLHGYNWTEAERKEIETEISSYRKDVYPYIKYNPEEITNDLGMVGEYLNKIGKGAQENGQQAPAVVIDYLHLLTSPGLETQTLISNAVVMLKDYAKTYNTFVICIAATNRASNKGGQLGLDAGRDSSAIEFTGDYALTLNYTDIDERKDKVDENQLKQEKPRRMTLRIVKNRFGVDGLSAKLHYDSANNIFYSGGDFMPVDEKNNPFGDSKKIKIL